MNVATFIQICVNNDISTVKTTEVMAKLGTSYNETYNELKRLEGLGMVDHWKNGSHSFWEITLGSSLPLCYEDMLDSDIPMCNPNYFTEASETSMRNNCVRPTTVPFNYREDEAIEPGLSIVGTL